MKKILLFLVLAWATGCSVDSKISESTSDDFALSKIVSHNEVFADGSTQMLVRVLLQHTDGRFAAGLTPSLSIVSGTGVVLDGCTPSNSDGVSICKLRSTVAGAKGIALNLSDLVPSALAQETVTFLQQPTNGGTITAIGGSDFLRQTAGGYTIHSRVGFESGKLSQTVSGYKIETTLVPVTTNSN